MIRPREDLALYRADMAAREPAEGANPPGWRSFYRDWVRANDPCRRDILDRLGVSAHEIRDLARWLGLEFALPG